MNSQSRFPVSKICAKIVLNGDEFWLNAVKTRYLALKGTVNDKRDSAFQMLNIVKYQ
jgi:hypothetical protein